MMFGTILLTIAAVMTAYVVWRTGGIPLLHAFSFPERLVTGGVVWVLIWLGRSFGHNNGGRLAAVIELIGMNLLVVVFLAFILILCIDLLTGFGWFVPELAPKLRGLALVTCILMSSLAIAQGMRAPVISKHEVTLSDLPSDLDGLVVVAMSDMHIGSQLGSDWLQARIAQVNELQPDMVVLLGDIFEGHNLPHETLLPVLRTLHAPLGVFAVLGNHEYYGRGSDPIQLMTEAGYRVLVNRWVGPAPGLTVAGVEDLTIHSRRQYDHRPVAETLRNAPGGAKILLSHTPLHTPEQMHDALASEVALVLSGHTHAGQIWPFGHLVGLRYPLLEGRLEIENMTVIVTRGTGTWGPRMRLWQPGEILHITLQSG